MSDFTPTEKRAVLFTVVIILIAAVIQWFKPYINNPSVIDYAQSDSIFYRLSQQKPAGIISGSHSTSATIQKKKKKKITPVLKSVNLNAATKKELEVLPRVGPKTAERIILYRNTHNGFKTHEELMEVKGIGPKTFEKIKPYLKDLNIL